MRSRQVGTRLLFSLTTAIALGSKPIPRFAALNTAPLFAAMCDAIAQPSKVPRMEGTPAPRIGTHDGAFHCDEALACWLLRKTKEFQNAEIIRTREPSVLANLDVVVDVGAVFDPERRRFDHHQREFSDTFSDKHKTKLSSAGLIYKYFGREILKDMLPSQSQDLEIIFNKIYDHFIEEMDGIDNGVPCFPTDLVPAYRVTTMLGQRVGRLNPRWNDPSPDPQAGFLKAMEMVGSEFSEAVDFYGNSWLPARAMVAQALEKRMEVDPSGAVIVLEGGGVPWKDHLFDLEAQIGANILYVLYAGEKDSWRVQAVPVRPESFKSRKSLPEHLCGLRDDTLSEKSGIPGGIFVHANGFIGGMKSFPSALQLVRLSLAAP